MNASPPSGPLLLGVDVGTTQIKVGAFSEGGEVVSLRAAPTPTVREGPQRAHHDPQELWAAVARLLRGVSRDLGTAGRARLAALGVGSFGESGVLVGRGGEAAGPVLAWFDDRPQAVLPQIGRALDFAELRARTGLLPDHTYSLPKLLWTAGQRSLGGLRWLSVADFIAARLTGEVSMGATQAARTLLLDVRALRWMPETLRALSLPGEVLPPLRAPGGPLGTLTAEAAALTELPSGLPVWEGAHDQPCAAAGIGAVLPGVTVNACGTAETLLQALELRDLDHALAQSGVIVGPHALPGLALAMTTLRASGSTFEWVLNLCGGKRELLLEQAGDLPADFDLLFFPHLRTLTDDPNVPGLPGGLFVGLRETHGPPHLVRAALEGLTFELAGLHDKLRAATGDARIGEAGAIRAVGGPTRNAPWMRLKADVLGVPVQVFEEPHATVWGAAWLAWHHLNAAAGQSVLPPRPRVRASYTPTDTAEYARRRERYDHLLHAFAAALHAQKGQAT